MQTARAASIDHYMAFPEDMVDGRKVSEYVNRWWQWTYTMPEDQSPVHDLTGAHCDAKQEGEVWFLAGGYGSSTITRSCVIPEGRYIFFPVINMVYWPRYEGSLTCDEAKRHAALNNDELLTIEVSLNSVSAWNPANTRIASEQCFDLLGMLPREINPPRVYPAATDGYWLMLKPLPKGEHVLKFQAQYDKEKTPYGKMLQDIEYHLTIQ